jgi:hypothetical protein
MSDIGRIGADTSTKRSGFDLGSIRVGFVVEKVALGQVFPPSNSVFPVTNIPPLIHSYLYHDNPFTGGKNG